MYTVFKISGPNSKAIYIGFCTTDNDNPLIHFLKGGTRSEDDRADVRFVEEHGGPDTLISTVLETDIDDMPNAVAVRNHYRANERHAFSGPTMFPLSAYKQAAEKDPVGTTAAFTKWAARKLATARLAYETGVLWSYDQIRLQMSMHGREQIRDDLTTLTPDQFAEKYDMG